MPSNEANGILLAELHDLYQVHTIQISPCDLGWLMDRLRQISICIRRDGMVWHGKGWEAFFDVFARRTVLSGAALWEVPAAYSRRIMRQKAASQGHVFIEEQDRGGTPLSFCLGPTSLMRSAQYEQLRATHCSRDGSFFYDVDQSSEWGSCGGFVPPLVSHGTLVSSELQQIAGGLQHLAVMGEPVFEHQRCGHGYVCAFQDLLDAGKLGECALKDLAGNAIHEPTLGMVILFCLASSSRRGPATILDLGMLCNDSTDGEEEQDEKGQEMPGDDSGNGEKHQDGEEHQEISIS